MRRLAGAAIALLVTAAACSSGPSGPFDGFRDLTDGQVIEYGLAFTQERRASGLGAEQRFPFQGRFVLEEEATGDRTYALVMRSITESAGEERQRVAAERLVGRRLSVDLDDGVVRGGPDTFSGTDDIAAADVALLTVLFAPVIPSPHVQPEARWRTRTVPIRVPWSLRPVHFTIDHEVRTVGQFHHLESVNVRSVALGNVRFRLPLVVPRDPARPPDAADDLIVNELFESLFADIDNPIEGFAAAITAIPLAIVAPFLAFGEALGSLFGGSDTDEAPELPVVDLAGPIELQTTTLIWTADGRVLDADTQGTLRLSGRLPELPGQASELSGKIVRLDVDLHIKRTHAAPFPDPRDPPGRGWIPILAAVLVALALAMASWSSITRRRGRA